MRAPARKKPAPKQPAKKRVSRASRERRTNSQRSAEMRGRLIQATIDILFESSYAAATTIEVAKRANVSRGAMLHHFPNRIELLVATAEHIILDQRQYRIDKLADVENNWQRFVAAADVSWEVQKQPATIALLEIMLAQRSDGELRKRMAPLLREMSALRAESAARFATTLGVTNVKPLDDLMLAHLASLRGLAISLLFTRDPEEVEAARNLLTQYERTYAKKLIAEQAAK
jgi:AcrR family transcriptional regulator